MIKYYKKYDFLNKAFIKYTKKKPAKIFLEAYEKDFSQIIPQISKDKDLMIKCMAYYPGKAHLFSPHFVVLSHYQTLIKWVGIHDLASGFQKRFNEPKVVAKKSKSLTKKIKRKPSSKRK